MKPQIMLTSVILFLASCTPTGAPKHPRLGFEIIDGLLDAVSCGSSLIGNEPPTAVQAIDASACFLTRLRDRANTADALELASSDTNTTHQPTNVMPTLKANKEHGQLVIEAAHAAALLEHHPCEEHRQAAIDAVRACLPPGIELGD